MQEQCTLGVLTVNEPFLPLCFHLHPLLHYQKILLQLPLAI